MSQSPFHFPRRRALPLLLGALLLPLPALAQDTPPGPAGAAADGTRPMQMNRMHGKHCPMMQGHGMKMPQMLHMPRLPPGNDKLQLQMEAEILQKIGEIQGKYASQLP